MDRFLIVALDAIYGRIKENMAILDEHEEEEVNASASEIKLKKKWPYGTFLNVQLCGSS